MCPLPRSWLLQALLVLLFLLAALAGLAYLLEQPALRELLPPEVLTHADVAKELAQRQLRSGVEQGRAWWESDAAQAMRDAVRDKVGEWVEGARPLVGQLLGRLNPAAAASATAAGQQAAAAAGNASESGGLGSSTAGN